MKILLVGDYPPPAGGVAVHVQQLHEFWRQRGVEAKVLDIGKGGRPVPDVIPVRTAWGLAMQLRRLVAQGYFVHLHTSGNNLKSWTLATLVGTVVKALHGHAVVTFHSGLLPAFLESSLRHRILARGAVALFDRVIAVSSAVRDSLQTVGAHRVEVLPAFVSADGAVLPQRLGDISFDPMIAYAHHPSPVYGRAVMLDALARLPTAGLVAFGPESQGAAFQRDVAERGLSQRVVALGELSHDEALGVLRAADVFVRPTLADGDAISVREALALGVPCVASDVAQRPAGVVTFRSEDVSDLVAKIDSVLKSPPVSFVSTTDTGARLQTYFEGIAG